LIRGIARRLEKERHTKQSLTDASLYNHFFDARDDFDDDFDDDDFDDDDAAFDGNFGSKKSKDQNVQWLVGALDTMIALAFNSATSTVSASLAHYGMDLLYDIVKYFPSSGNISHQARITSAVRPAFQQHHQSDNVDDAQEFSLSTTSSSRAVTNEKSNDQTKLIQLSHPSVVVSACEVVVLYLCNNKITSSSVVRRLITLLTQHLDALHAIKYPIYSEEAATRVQLSIVTALATLYTLEETPLVDKVKPFLEPHLDEYLLPSWMGILRDFAVLTTQPKSVQKQFHGIFYTFTTAHHNLHDYQRCWSIALLAASTHLRSGQTKPNNDDLQLLFGLSLRSISFLLNREPPTVMLALRSLKILLAPSCPAVEDQLLTPQNVLYELISILCILLEHGNHDVKHQCLLLFVHLLRTQVISLEYWEKQEGATLMKKALHQMVEAVLCCVYLYVDLTQIGKRSNSKLSSSHSFESSVVSSSSSSSESSVVSSSSSPSSSSSSSSVGSNLRTKHNARAAYQLLQLSPHSLLHLFGSTLEFVGALGQLSKRLSFGRAYLPYLLQGIFQLYTCVTNVEQLLDDRQLASLTNNTVLVKLNQTHTQQLLSCLLALVSVQDIEGDFHWSETIASAIVSFSKGLDDACLSNAQQSFIMAVLVMVQEFLVVSCAEKQDEGKVYALLSTVINNHLAPVLTADQTEMSVKVRAIQTSRSVVLSQLHSNNATLKQYTLMFFQLFGPLVVLVAKQACAKPPGDDNENPLFTEIIAFLMSVQPISNAILMVLMPVLVGMLDTEKSTKHSGRHQLAVQVCMNLAQQQPSAFRETNALLAPSSSQALEQAMRESIVEQQQQAAAAAAEQERKQKEANRSRRGQSVAADSGDGDGLSIDFDAFG